MNQNSKSNQNSTLERIAENINIDAPTFSSISATLAECSQYSKLMTQSPKYTQSSSTTKNESDIEPNYSPQKRQLRQWFNKYSSLGSDLEKGINNPEVSDIVFILDSKKVYASKFVLCMRSKFFRKMLLETSENEIELEEVDYDTFLTALEFLYTDRITVEKLDQKKIFDLILLADKLDLPELKIMCEDFLSSQLSNENVINLLQKATTVNANNLRDKCMKFIIQSPTLEKNELKNLSKEILMDLFTCAVTHQNK